MRLLSKILLLSTLLTYSCFVSAQYKLTLNDVALSGDTIVNYINTIEKNIEIPGKIDSNIILTIADYAFANKELETITIEEGVKTIGNYAFYNNKINTATLPKSVDSIGRMAFADNEITRLTFPIGKVRIGYAAFNSNKIKEINGKASYGIIYMRNFEGIDDMINIVSYGGESDEIKFIPKSVKTIHPFAFAGNGLTYVDIPKGVEIIERDAFTNNSITELDIPKTVTSIGSRAFMTNQITRLNIPSSVSMIGKAAFNDNKIRVYNEMPSKGIIYARMSDGTENKSIMVSYAGAAENVNFIPTSIITIDDYAFANCNVSAVEMPRLLAKIGNYAFYENRISEVIIPERVEKIEKAAFANNNLTKVEIKNKCKLEMVSDSAFAGNDSLKAIVMPYSIVNDFAGWREISVVDSLNSSKIYEPGDTVVNFENAYIANGVRYAARLTFKTEDLMTLGGMTFSVDNTIYKTNHKGEVTAYLLPGIYKFTGAKWNNMFFRCDNAVTLGKIDSSYKIIMQNKRY